MKKYLAFGHNLCIQKPQITIANIIYHTFNHFSICFVDFFDIYFIAYV